MKAKAALITVALTLGAFGSTLLFVPRQSHAAGLGGGEQYKVLDLRDVATALQLEEELNKLAADGWKVRTATATTGDRLHPSLILAK